MSLQSIFSVFCSLGDDNEAVNEFVKLERECLSSAEQINIECVNCVTMELVDSCIR